MGKPIPFVAPETLQLLEAYQWPGNVRELQDAVLHALIETSTDVLTPESLPDNVRRARPAEASPGDIAAMVRKLIQDGEKNIRKKVALESQRIAFQVALEIAGGNKGQAADLLGISRSNFWRKLRGFEKNPPAKENRAGPEE